jgi:dienelactone hydrolase
MTLRPATVSALVLLMLSSACTGQSTRKTEIREGGLVANLWRPAGEGPHPGVLLLGGSGGGIGWQDHVGELLAERGYAALALAYFGLEGLPSELERIPIEYVDLGLMYLGLQPDVDRTRLGVVGVSKGGELALLIASMRPELQAIVAFVPSSVVWQSVADGFPQTSSWSLRGREVPYVSYGDVENPSSTADFYRAGLEQSSTLEAATIPVEGINGPILLLSGREDNLWPSTMLSEQVVERLEANGFAHPVDHVAYPDAGHLISRVREDDVSGRGGTEEGNRAAQVDARDRMLAFLRDHLMRR